MTPATTLVLFAIFAMLLRIVYSFVSQWLMVRDLLKRIEQAEPMTDEEWELEMRREDALYTESQ